MIVDDMPVIRSAVSRILSTKEYLFAPLIEASNGQEAVELARIHKPDIILMDIKMPELTGLQATAIIRENQPDVKIVMLTAYNEFSYVQKALKLGARDFLLKPVRPETLVELLVEIKREIADERRELRTVKIVKDSLQRTLPVIETNLVENLIRGTHPEGKTVDETLAYLGKRLSYPAVLVAKADDYDQVIKGKSQDELQQMHTALVQLVRDTIAEPQRALVGYSNPGRIVVIMSTEEHLTTYRRLRVFADLLRMTIAARMPFTVTIGFGRRRADLSSIPLSYAEANLARRYRGREQKNLVIGVDDILEESPTVDDTSHYLVQRKREVVRMVQLNRQQEAQKLINEIVDYLSQRYYMKPDAVKNHCAELVTLVAWGVIGTGVDEPIVLDLLHQQVRALSSWRSVPEIRAWTLNSLAEMMALVQGVFMRQDAMQAAVAYIRTNYQRADLSLNEVANVASLSQSHFSSQFKARTGKSYVKFLTALRLEAAKKLLLTSDHSVATISEMVGYPNATNFYRHFRRQTGVTPAVYRAEHGER